jgi:hypothetical protein
VGGAEGRENGDESREGVGGRVLQARVRERQSFVGAGRNRGGVGRLGLGRS